MFEQSTYFYLFKGKQGHPSSPSWLQMYWVDYLHVMACIQPLWIIHNSFWLENISLEGQKRPRVDNYRFRLTFQQVESFSLKNDFPWNLRQAVQKTDKMNFRLKSSNYKIENWGNDECTSLLIKDWFFIWLIISWIFACACLPCHLRNTKLLWWNRR